MTRRIRSALLAAALIATPAVLAPAAHGAGLVRQDEIGARAEAYVQKALDEVVEVLAIADPEEKRARLRDIIETYIDTNRVAQSTLGKYRRSASRDQLREFIPLFKEYAIGLYEEQIENYGGERFRVTGSVVRSERDVIVNTVVVGGSEFDGTVVQWRVYVRDGELQVVDVGAENIWLGIEQQSQFTSFIADNGGAEGGIDALIADLKRRVGEPSDA